jgi:hypothetical protein
VEHRFRPFHAVLGVAMMIVGVLVAVFGFEQIEDDSLMVWAAVAAAVIGASLLPWPRRASGALPEESSPEG